MIGVHLCVFILIFHNIHCLTLQKEFAYLDPHVLASVNDDCDPSTIPVLDSFDMKRFSGKWFELAKTAGGYIDVSDGVWLIEGTNTTNKFLYSGRDNNQHCIRPIKGGLSAAKEPPGMLTLKYQTYSTHVEETVRVLFTDYVSVAVIYTCMFHVHHEKEVCHAAGLFGAIWTRAPHVDVDVYEKAMQYLEMACIQKTTLIIRNVIGPCRVDYWDIRIDDFPAPDYCYQPVDLGSCRGSIQRYYFDPKEKICKIFNYGGCGGNKNNFMSLPECQKNCISASEKDPVCMSIAKCGLHCSPCCTEDRNGCVQCNCEHIIEDDFLNCVKTPSQCASDCDVENFYPGCYVCRCDRGTKIDETALGVCNEVKIVGNCNNKIERFYYNNVDDKCEKFIYSGCNGNNNNFNTQQECEVKCLSLNNQLQNSIQKLPDDEEPDDSTAIECNFFLILLAVISIYFHNIMTTHSKSL
ncbi:Kunitz-type protease inhibitor 1 [Araneus ventricosus]|uniref:Kunitz-type protease inhibitor 1 n=1 Tax=Araneus ventricosus TaxID=182803 RepID=A0A4Y2AEC2_ARAVE|nr:Kunitz-type protease inhibitor 1 [Araneus ventricosus]